jgi:hypothetical protein
MFLLGYVFRYGPYDTSHEAKHLQNQFWEYAKPKKKEIEVSGEFTTMIKEAIDLGAEWRFLSCEKGRASALLRTMAYLLADIAELPDANLPEDIADRLVELTEKPSPGLDHS